MRKLCLVLVATLAAVVPSLVVAGPVHAKPPKPQAELVAKAVSGLLSDGKVTASANVKNKGNLKAGTSQTTFRLSTDGTASADDAVLGTVDTGKIKPKKSKPVSGTFAVPASVVAGTYRVVACADSGLIVPERKETNNCKASKNTVTLTVAPANITVSATAGTGGTVAASGVTGGTCAATTCTLQPGNSKVTFTPTADAGYRFGSWTGATCSGFTTGPGNAITFTNPTTAKACTAGFVKQVTIAWSVTGGTPVVGVGSVAGTVSAGTGTCTAAGASGTCTVDSGAATVVLTATGVPVFATFSTWGPAVPATCTGVASGADSSIFTLTNAATNQGCLATFTGVV